MASQSSFAAKFAASRLRTLALGALILGATLAAYFPVIRGGFIWDDDGHVTKPELRSLHGLWRIWTDPGATEQYYPLLHSAFWIEHRLWGEAAAFYHLTNILLHGGAACLLVLVLRRLAVRGALLAGLIFALHPVCVESVAWISEQKNTLSLVFYLAAALAYLRFDESRVQVGDGGRGSDAGGRRPPSDGSADLDSAKDSPARRSAATGRSAATWAYPLATMLFVLALLSKSVTATLPAALLVVFWWKRGRLSWKGDILPLVPWLVLGAGTGLFTAWVERRFIGAQGAAFDFTWAQRLLLAGRAVWFYLGKLLWPADLTFVYPRWELQAAQGWLWYPLGAVALVMASWLVRGRTRAPLAGLLFFIGSLFPVLGFFNVYPFIFSFVADHWQYLPSLGIIVPVSAGIVLTLERVAWPVKRIGWVFVGALLGGLGLLTWRQCRLYRDPETLFLATIDRNPACWMAYDNLGIAAFNRGRVAEAIARYGQALRIRSDLYETHNYLGNALQSADRIPEAISHYREALRIKPDYPEAHDNLGAALAKSGRPAEAMLQFEEALRLRPDYPEAHNNLGVVLAASGRWPEAIAHFEQALRLDPGYAEARRNLDDARREARPATP